MASSYSGVRNRSRDETSPPSGQNPFADDGQNNPPHAGYAEDGPSQDVPRNQNRPPASGYAEGSSRDQNRPPAQTGYTQDGPEGQPRRSRSGSPSDRHRRNNSSRFSLFVIIPLLATLLIILAFALAIATTASPRWASKRAYSNSSDISSYMGIIHRNPFGPCVISLNPSGSSSQADNQTCIAPQYDLSVGKSTYSLGWDTPLICSALKLTKNLLIAGCILLGLAFIISLALFVIGFFPPADEEREAGTASSLKLFGWSPSARFTSLAALLLLLLVAPAAFCIAIAQLLGAWAFLTQQLPNARFGRPGTPSFLGAWYADQGLSLAGAAWVCAGFAALSVPIAWRMPRGYI